MLLINPQRCSHATVITLEIFMIDAKVWDEGVHAMWMLN